MQENHKAEQYFFDGPTLARLARCVLQFKQPVLLCAPMLGQYLWERNPKHQVTVLDIDTRFAHLPGFQQWDIHRPKPLGFKPDLILCDPPFNTVKMDRLYKAFMVLTGQDTTCPLIMSWVSRREQDVLGAFSRFNLQPTDFYPSYVTVGPEAGIRFYSSWGQFVL